MHPPFQVAFVLLRVLGFVERQAEELRRVFVEFESRHCGVRVPTVPNG